MAQFSLANRALPMAGRGGTLEKGTFLGSPTLGGSPGEMSPLAPRLPGVSPAPHLLSPSGRSVSTPRPVEAIFGRERREVQRATQRAGDAARRATQRATQSGTQRVAKTLKRAPQAVSGSSRGPTLPSKISRGTQRVVKGLEQAAEARYREGIFGTSGAFGFTKANELFVGRVAMLGFAASLVGEAVTGQGILAQLNLETGIPVTQAPPLLLLFVGFTLLGAVGGLGSLGRFEADPLQPLRTDNARTALGLASRGPLFGFTKANEVFVGRIAQLGIASSILGEILTGRGALAQLNVETGVPVWELQPLVLFFIVFMLVAAINPGKGRFVNDEDVGE